MSAATTPDGQNWAQLTAVLDVVELQSGVARQVDREVPTLDVVDQRPRRVPGRCQSLTA